MGIDHKQRSVTDSIGFFLLAMGYESKSLNGKQNGKHVNDSGHVRDAQNDSSMHDLSLALRVHLMLVNDDLLRILVTILVRV